MQGKMWDTDDVLHANGREIIRKQKNRTVIFGKDEAETQTFSY